MRYELQVIKISDFFIMKNLSHWTVI
jgi:hypothetical protein